jgi:hypothetical protein
MKNLNKVNIVICTMSLILTNNSFTSDMQQKLALAKLSEFPATTEINVDTINIHMPSPTTPPLPKTPPNSVKKGLTFKHYVAWGLVTGMSGLLLLKDIEFLAYNTGFLYQQPTSATYWETQNGQFRQQHYMACYNSTVDPNNSRILHMDNKNVAILTYTNLQLYLSLGAHLSSAATGAVLYYTGGRKVIKYLGNWFDWAIS